MKILYVEDNEDNIFMLSMFLKRKGYEVFIAKDGQAGVDQAKTLLPDLILMDIGLPVLDGYAATQQIKKDEKTKHIPIIILTAHALSIDKEKALQSGADEYVSKPVNLQVLMKVLEKFNAK